METSFCFFLCASSLFPSMLILVFALETVLVLPPLTLFLGNILAEL